MKTLFGLTLLFLVACADKSKSNDPKKINFSAAQIGIQNIVDSFKLEYKKGNTQELRDKYKQKIYDYLADNYIDSIRVHVDTVIIDSLTITTAFHCNKDIAFKYSLTFKKNMAPNEDSLFRFMKGLRAGIDTTISFAYTGSHELNDPQDTSLPTLRIFAFPTPQFSNRQ